MQRNGDSKPREALDDDLLARTKEHKPEILERAFAERRMSSLWPELKRAPPPKTFEVLAGIANYREEAPSKVWTWKELEATFETEMRQRILLGKLADSTWERDQQTLRGYKSFLTESGVSELAEMNRPFIEKFKVWRLAKIREKNFSRGGRGLALDVAIPHRVFGVALECEMIAKNPVRSANYGEWRRIGENRLHKSCTDRTAKQEGSVISKDLTADGPVSRNLRAHFCFQ